MTLKLKNSNKRPDVVLKGLTPEPRRKEDSKIKELDVDPQRDDDMWTAPLQVAQFLALQRCIPDVII